MGARLGYVIRGAIVRSFLSDLETHDPESPHARRALWRTSGTGILTFSRNSGRRPSYVGGLWRRTTMPPILPLGTMRIMGMMGMMRLPFPLNWQPICFPSTRPPSPYTSSRPSGSSGSRY